MTQLRGIGWIGLAAVAVVLLVCGCAKTDDPTTPPPASPVGAKPPPLLNATDPRWVKQSSPRSKAAVVLVHGIFGDTLGTWALEGKTPFYDYVLQDQAIARSADFFAFGFTSNMLQPGSLDVREAANKLDQALQFHGVSGYKHIVFVAHSMGGLVVMRHLTGSPGLVARVPLVVLYGTPQEGAQIAAIADRVANNPALKQMFPANGNLFLQQLDDDWKSLPQKTRPVVVCGYEKLKTDGVMIVPWDSATRFCSEKAPAMEGADHLTMVKPDRLAHPAVVLLVNAFNQHVMPTLEGRLEMPDFVADGSQYVFNLADGLGTARLVNPGKAPVRYTIGAIQTPGLVISPHDTPKDIEAEGTAQVLMALTIRARANEYRFKLTTDIPTETTVVVKAPDVVALRSAREKQWQKAVAAIGEHVQRPEVARRLAAGGDARETVALAAKDALWRDEPRLSEGTKWLLTADILASTWPEIGAVALRKSEWAAPSLASTPTAQQLAGFIAQHTGEKRVFASAPTPSMLGRPTPDHLYRGPSNGELGLATASKMKEIPQLRAFGLALEGDSQKARGANAEARKAYAEASRLNRSPAMAERIRALEPSPPTGLGYTGGMTRRKFLMEEPNLSRRRAIVRPAPATEGSARPVEQPVRATDTP